MIAPTVPAGRLTEIATPGRHTRSRQIRRESALYLTWLAEALVQGGEVERASDVAERALQLADGASRRVEQRIGGLRRILVGFHDPARGSFRTPTATR